MRRQILILLGFTVLIFLCASSSYSNNINELNTAIQARGARWIAKETPFSNIPNEEWRKWTGSPDDFSLSGMPLEPPFYYPFLLPSSFDWTNNEGNYITSVKTQLSCAACGVFTWIAAMESKFLITHDLPGVDLNLSEQIVLSCSGATNCGGGGTLEGIFDFLQTTGTYLERCYAFTGTDGDCSKACYNWQTNAYKIDGWRYLISYSFNNKADLSVIKNALYANGPLPVLMKIYEDFFNYGEGVYTHTSGNYVDTHWVLLVGWDDAKGALKCKNSWGTVWGDEGFFWISYNELFGTGPAEFGRIVLALGNVLQSQVMSISVSQTNLNAAQYVGTTSFSVSNTGTGTMPWSASVTSGSSWLSITSGATGSNSGTITCNYSINTTTSSRTATIRITASGATGSPVDVTVTQASAGQPYEIYYDDGVYDAITSPWSDQYGSEMAVRFDAPSYPTKINKVRFFVTWWQEPMTQFRVYIYDTNNGIYPGTRLDDGSIYGQAIEGQEWVDIDISNKNIELQRGFFISMYWIKAPGANGDFAQFLGYDTTTDAGRTFWKHGYSGSWYSPSSTGNSMIRAVVADIQAPTPMGCNATIDEKLLLHIPYLSYVNPISGTLSLWAELLYEFNPTYPTLILFKLSDAGIITSPSYLCEASTLSYDFKIHIPDVLLPDGSTHLWVDLEYRPALSIDVNAYFVVTDFGLIDGFLTLPYLSSMPLKELWFVDVLLSDQGTFRDWMGGQQTWDRHLGIDFIPDQKYTGWPVIAAAPGKVIQAKWYDEDGYIVILEHTGGYYSIYAHLSDIRTTIGAYVARGDEIAGFGRTGSQVGPDVTLHFQIDKGWLGGDARVDPYDDLLNPTDHSLWTIYNTPQFSR
jgi:hypothetical protein